MDAYRPLSPGLVRRLRDELMIEYTYDSNAIEGSTLTLRETRLVIEEGVTVGGRSLGEHLAARNHPEAIRYVEGLMDDGGELGEVDILRLHGLILRGIEEDTGEYRSSGVRVAGATFSPPPSVEVGQRVRELLVWLESNPEEFLPVELAAVFHHRFVQIHPFTEGNGRTARLLMNIILMGYGYPFIVNITSRDRGKYLRALSEADMGDDAVFVDFVALSVERALDVYIQALEEPRLLTLAEASRLVPYSQEYLSLLARRGALGAFKKGRNWIISREDLERYLLSLKRR